jgi:hypothetical protein
MIVLHDDVSDILFVTLFFGGWMMRHFFVQVRVLVSVVRLCVRGGPSTVGSEKSVSSQVIDSGMDDNCLLDWEHLDDI